MNRSLLTLLAIALLGSVVISIPSRARAAAFPEGDYVRIGVPDLPQAVGFFRDVLDCQPISAPAPARQPDGRGDRTGSELLACESGTIVELVQNSASPASSQKPARQRDEPVRFTSANVAGAGQWLGRKGVRVIGSPHTLTSGPHAGMTIVNFEAPWGLRLQLAGWDTNMASAVH
jgi:catechol 2,3-dioxygenase-like lactoylglutathione lyase family enzyme